MDTHEIFKRNEDTEIDTTAYQHIFTEWFWLGPMLLCLGIIIFTPNLGIAEVLTIPPEVCNDGIDNDMDGIVDYEDPECTPVGTVYYIDASNGRDYYNGKAPRWDGVGVDGPFRSASKIADMLITDPKANPKDKVGAVLLKRGQEWKFQNTITIDRAVGTAVSPIILGAYGTGSKPRLTRSLNLFYVKRPILSIQGSYQSIEPQYLIIENLVISGARGFLPISELDCISDQNKDCLVPAVQIGNKYFSNTYKTEPHHITLRHCNIENNNYGLSVSYHGGSIVVEDNDIKNNGYPSKNFELRSQGIHATGRAHWFHYPTDIDVTIRGNTFYNNGYYNYDGKGSLVGNPYSWNLYIDGTKKNGKRFLIEGNTFLDSYTGLKVRNIKFARISGNIFDGMKNVAMVVGGDQNGWSKNIVVEKNVFSDNGVRLKDGTHGGGLAIRCQDACDVKNVNAHQNGTDDIVVRNNRFYHKDGYTGGGYGMRLSGSHPVTKAYIYNNVFYNIQGDGLLIGSDLNDYSISDVDIRNNIFSKFNPNNGSYGLINGLNSAQIDIEYNLFSWFSSEDYGVEPVFGDPGFVDPDNSVNPDFHLRCGSAAIDVGYDNPSIVNDDIDGDRRPIFRTDIGIDELTIYQRRKCRTKNDKYPDNPDDPDIDTPPLDGWRP